MIGKKVTETLSVSPQIQAQDVATIAAAGFQTIVCNRPDGEDPDQPTFSEIETAAETHGLTIRYQPVISGQLKEGDVEAFSALSTELPGPIFAYCRSGTRCIMLWALSEASHRPVAEVLEMARAAGYDLSG